MVLRRRRSNPSGRAAPRRKNITNMNRRLRYASAALHRRLVPYTAAKETWTLPLRRLSSQSHDLAIIERGIGFGDGHASNQFKHRQRQTDLITDRNHTPVDGFVQRL